MLDKTLTILIDKASVLKTLTDIEKIYKSFHTMLDMTMKLLRIYSALSC